MRKERDRIVAWLLTFVMVFLMAVGDEQIVWAGDEYVNVTVTVTDSNENPITGATVKPYLNGAEYTRKDAVDNEDGTYTLELLSGTAFRIKVSADGYVSGEITAATYSSESNTASITLETCSISGKVLDGSSNGISGATVTATPGSDGSTLTTTTGSDGSYTINSGVIYNETYTITVSSTGYDTSSISESVTIGQASNTVSNITLSDTVELVITLTSSTVTSGETMTPTVKAGTEDVSRDVTWSVDSTSTGSVIINGTTFTAGDAGTVILTATYGAATATVTVTINAKSQTITVQDGTETVSTITKTYGDTATYTVDGVGTLTAESSDKDVVEVSSTATDGFTVKFTGVGTATLTVTRAGDSQNASASKEISVTVNRRTVTVTVTAATGDDGTLETEVQSVSNAADSDTDLANYIEIMTSQYTDEDKSIVGYTLGWSNSASSAYKTNYTFTDSGTISTASASYTKSEVEAGVTISKVYDGTKTITSNMVTITAEDNGGTDISSYITLDFDSSTFGNVNVGESKTVNYILTWTDNAPASVTNLYSLPSGTQSGSVGTVTAREVKIQSITLMNRKYDGTDVVEITTGTACVKLKEEQTSLDADDLNDQVAALYLTGTVNVDSADAGTRTATGFDEVELATDEEDVEASNFTLISSDTASYFTSNTVTVTISRAIIYLQFSDLIYTYDDVPNGINQVNCSCLSETADNTTVNVTIYEYVFGCTETDDLMTGAQEALKEYSKTWSLALTASELDTDEESLEPGLDVGSYENKIGLTGLVSTDDTVDVGTNYQLQVKEAAQFGDITVTQDDTTYDIDDVTAAGSFYIKDNTLYVKSGATFTVSQNVDDTLYDQVWIGTESDDSVTFTTNLTAGVTIDDLVAAGSGKDVTLYLAKNGKNVSQGFTITLHNDGTAPSTAFAVGEETLDSQDFASSVTFGVIDNKTVTVDLTVEDAESGIASIETYLYTGSKAEIDALDGQKDTLDDLSGIWEWAEATIEEDYGSSEAYTVSAAYTVESNTYAVAFARVTDTVGNICIYGSNGLVVEVNTPNVPTITYSTAKNYGDGVYNGDVSVTIQVSEKLASEEDIASGLQSVTYTIYKDGKAVSGYTDVELFEDTLEEAIAGGTVTLEQLQSAVSMKLEKTVTIPASVFNSNNVYVAVRVTDQARNTSEATGVVIQIDVTEPTIEVSYDNNSAANTHYFKKARTATIVYTERNFDIEKVTFDLTLADGAKRTLSFRELGAIAGIRISYAASEDDSQYGRSTSNYTDVRTNTLTITFSGDNDYTVVPYFEDLAGNEPEEIAYASSTAEETKTHFIIDTTAPTISITYYDADGNVVTPGKSEKTRLYEDGTVRAVVTITEHNFAGSSKFVSGQITYTVTAADAEGNTVTVSDYQSSANTLSGWKENTDVWTSAQFKFSTDANYVAGFTYTDLAGNSVTWKNDYYTVDKTAPTGTVSVGSLGSWSSFSGKITFGLFSRKSQRVRITADDAISPVQSISYLTATGKMTKTQLAASDKWKKYSPFVRKANRQFIVYARIVDAAGNVTYLSSAGVVLDSAAPGPEITITVDDAGNGIYNGDVPFTIQVTDPTRGGTYAGLQSVSYEILCDGEVTQSGNFDAELTPASRRVQSLTRRLTVNAKRNNSNDVVIRVTAVDNAGNTAAAKQALKIDITKPVISVTYNDIPAENNTYYKDTRVATVTVTERNFDASGVHFSIANTDGTQPAISGWSHSADSGVSDSATHTCTVTFSADGDYTFTVEATDRAANTGSYGQTDRFTVDRTVPVLRVSYDNNNVTGGSYYNAARTATVTIREHNFDASAVTAAITASLNGQGLTAPVLSSFHSDGDIHTATISYTADADYTFTISCTDRAGNEAADYETERFTVDTRKPEIVIGNVVKANTGMVQPTVEVTDQNYVDAQVTITLSGAHNGEMELSTSVAFINQGQKFTLADLAHEPNLDDIYTLKVTATDKAGNTNEDSYTFSVNRFGSVYTLDDATAAMLESYYISSPVDLVIEETNTNDLNESWIVCTKDGENYTLEEGVHYTVEKSGGDGSWTVYKYTINKENFAEDGVYVITMYSEDAAGNTSSNQAKEKTIEFVVDATPPSIVVTGISNRGQYRQDTQDITIDAQDNIYLASLRVYILDDDGEVLTSYDFTEEEMTENYGTVGYMLTSYSDWQTVRVTATDAAGNQAVSEDITVLINPSRLLQYYMNKPMFYGSLAILLLLAVFIGCSVSEKGKQAGVQRVLDIDK